jgi:hypothetical protein
MEEIRNQKKKRRKENKNMKLGLRETLRPRKGNKPAAQLENPEPVHFVSLSLSL